MVTHHIVKFLFALFSTRLCAEVTEDSGKEVKVQSGEFLQRQSKPAAVSCLLEMDPQVEVPPGSGANTTCVAGTCCHLYNLTFACPAGSTKERQSSKCHLHKLPSALSKVRQMLPEAPPESLYDGNPYGGVELEEETLKEFLQKQPGVVHADVLNRSERGHGSAFYPPQLTLNPDKLGSFRYLWGDLGSEVGPGYGGLKSYDVVKLRTSHQKPLQLFHLNSWNEQHTDMCDIWWGLQSDFAVNQLQSNINVQTCFEFDAIVRCDFAAVELTTIVGQGWQRSSNGAKTMGCNENSRIVKELSKRGWPDAAPSTLQFVLPACELAFQLNMKCQACRIPQDKLWSLESFAGQFDHPDLGTECKEMNFTKWA